MNHCRKPLCAALLSAVVAGAGGVAWGDEPTTQPDVTKEIQALRARIDQLEAQQKQQELKHQQEAQDLALRSAQLEADRQSRFLDTTPIVGGWNDAKKQFFIGSEDGNFYLHPGIIFQFRENVNYRDHAIKGRSDTEEGFEVRRVKLNFDGNLFTPDLTYRFQWQDNSAGSPSLEYGWAQYVYAKNVGLTGNGDLAVRAGQTKDIVFKEEFTGDQNQLMVERSLANTLIGGNAPPLNLIQGVDFLLIGKNNPLHAEVELHDGFGSALTNFTQPHGPPVVFPQTPVDPPTNPGYWGASARVDWKVFGDWADTLDFTGVNSGKKDLLDIGGGVDYTDAQGASAIRYTADAQYQISKKLAVFGAAYGSHFDFRGTKAGSPIVQNNYGAQVEGGYLLDPSFQLIARYSVVSMDSKFRIASVGTFQEIAAGFNWFGPNGSWGNHAKFSLDVNYLPDGVPGGTTGLDYLANGKKNEEIVLRTQFQLWF